MHLDITFGLLIAHPLFRTREAFSHPYFSFFHLLVNGFFCYNKIIIFINFFKWVFSECTEAIAKSLSYTTRNHSS